MWFNKVSVLLSAIVAVIALIIAIISYRLNGEFITDIFINIFSGGLLSFALSLIGYWHERKKTFEDFWVYGEKAIRNINRFEWDGELERTIDIVLLMNEHDYAPFDSAFGNINLFFFNKKTRAYIYNFLYKPVCDIRNAITEKAYHFKEYKKAVNGNKNVMSQFIEELDSLIMETKHSTIKHDDGSETACTSRHNKIVKGLRDELRGKYYKIMYPYKRGKEAE